MLHAYNATTGEELWSHNNGIGHIGGIISYGAGGKQYVAVMTGWGSLVGDEYPALFGGALCQHAEGLRRARRVHAALTRVNRSGGMEPFAFIPRLASDERM